MSDRTEKAFYSFFQKWLKHTAPVPYYLLSSAAAMRLPNEPADLPADIPLEEVLPLYDGRRATLNLNIIIVWAGIGGPRRGPHIPSRHVARVYPCTGRGGRRDLGLNAMQLLLHWGLDAVQPTAIVFRQYDTGERLGYTRWAPHVVRDHARRSARSGRRRRAEHQARCSIPASSLARTVIRASYRGPSRGPMTSPRRMPHDAGVCYPITSDELQPRDSALFPFSSLTVRSELRSLLKTQRFSAPYCRTSRHSHRFWLFSKLTKTFGEYHPSFTKPLTDLREGYCT